MEYYRLSPARVRRIMHSPKRVEEGVAPSTVAMMQPASMKVSAKRGSKAGVWTQELWVMVQDSPKRRTVISAWRYPGVSKPRGEIADVIAREYRAFVGR